MKVMMVVEDNADMQMLIELTLGADTRLDVTGRASTASDAIELAKEMQPDLIVLDHFIFGDTMGLEAAPEIKQAAPGAVILLFSSHDLTTEASREPAVDEFLFKNNISDLLPTVQRLLGLTPQAA